MHNCSLAWLIIPRAQISRKQHILLLTAFHKMLAIFLLKTDALLDLPYDWMALKKESWCIRGWGCSKQGGGIGDSDSALCDITKCVLALQLFSTLILITLTDERCILSLVQIKISEEHHRSLSRKSINAKRGVCYSQRNTSSTTAWWHSSDWFSQ